MKLLALFTTMYLILSLEKGVIGEEDEDGHGCPKLASSALRVVCEERGKTVDCSEARTGTVAKPVWKKNIVKQAKKSKNAVVGLKCSQSGQWKTTSVSEMGGGSIYGYEKVENLGLMKLSLIGATYDAAVAICQQEGATVFALDTHEKIDFIRQDYIRRNAFIYNTVLKDDLWTGVSNLENKAVFKSTAGLIGDQIAKFNERHNKNNFEKQCVVYNVKRLMLWQGPCIQDPRPFYCIISSEDTPKTPGSQAGEREPQ